MTDTVTDLSNKYSAAAAAAKSLQSCLTLCHPMIAARQASLSITNSWSSLRLMSIELVHWESLHTSDTGVIGVGFQEMLGSKIRKISEVSAGKNSGIARIFASRNFQ